MQTFHHIGIPTSFKRDNETYLEDAKLYITDVADNEYNIEWLRFEEGSPMPEILKTTAHVAYMVDDLEKAMKGKQTLLAPFEPMEGLRVAFILDDGAPIEFMQTI
jgi:hypothetical protein